MLCIKTSDKATHYERNREIILNRAKEYYKNQKERVREQAWNKHRELSKEEKL